MDHLNARTGLGPQIKLYRGDELLATFASLEIFMAIMKTAGVVEFNAAKRTEL